MEEVASADRMVILHGRVGYLIISWEDFPDLAIKNGLADKPEWFFAERDKDYPSNNIFSEKICRRTNKASKKKITPMNYSSGQSPIWIHNGWMYL